MAFSPVVQREVEYAALILQQESLLQPPTFFLLDDFSYKSKFIFIVLFFMATCAMHSLGQTQPERTMKININQNNQHLRILSFVGMKIYIPYPIYLGQGQGGSGICGIRSQCTPMGMRCLEHTIPCCSSHCQRMCGARGGQGGAPKTSTLQGLALCSHSC